MSRLRDLSTSSGSTAGYSLIELLVAMMLSSVVLAGIVWEFGFVSRTRMDLEQLVEAQQSARAAIAVITQEMRQAGACLPRTGDPVALNGTDEGTRDTLTVRIGRVRRSDLTCIRVQLSAAAPQGSSVLQVQSTSGFAADSLVYVRGSTGSGNTFTVSGVSVNSLLLSTPLDADYDATSWVYALEERTYAVDASADPPVLTVRIDGGAAQPLVPGVEAFNVQYVTTPCPPCDTLDAPQDDEEWLLVREVAIDVTVRSRKPNRAGEYIRLTSRSNIKPRNLL
jgi:prepilin-type N-terminal cleavage/methylation domain-containing protein